jgi:hypothetical protein
MTPEFAFVLGVTSAYLAAWVGYLIISTVQTRLTEEEQWKTVLSESDPSATYWNRSVSDQATSEPEESSLIRVYSPRRID